MYQSVLDIKQTQFAIKSCKDFFERELAKALNLVRVSAPLFVTPESGLNDCLNGVERPVEFDLLETGAHVQIVQSLAKWKRYALGKYGFDVNVDLIAGLADETPETFACSVEKAVKTGAENITVHCLSLKSGAKLKEETDYLENDFISTMVASSRQILTEKGYAPYYMYRQKYQAGNNENVGWTKKGKACVYNIDVMEETADNLAVGANAISKRVFTKQGLITRFASQKDLRTYIENIDELIAKKRNFFK